MLSQNTHILHGSREAHTEDHSGISTSGMAQRLLRPSSAAAPKPSLWDAGSWRVMSWYGPDAWVVSQEGQMSVSSAVSGDFWTGQQSAWLLVLSRWHLGMYLSWYSSPTVTQPLCLWRWHRGMKSTRQSEHSYTKAAHKLLETLSPTPINLSLPSKISKSCWMLVIFEQSRSSNFQEHLSLSPLRRDFDLSFQTRIWLQRVCICHLLTV